MIKTTRSHSIADAGMPFVVDPFTRKVTVPPTCRVIGVVGDSQSEKVTFQVPNTIDGHFMPNCVRKYVAWRNVVGEPGSDELEMVEQSDDYSIYGWVVRDATTVAKGLVDFSLHFECEDANGKTIYRWGTNTCSDCEILDSVNTRLGTYAAIYIDGDTLVFADYTPITDGAIDLKSAIAPEGTLQITEAGKHDVGRYAYAEVVFTENNAPSIPDVAVQVSNDGVIIAHLPGTTNSTTHELSSTDCPAFLPENIKKGQTIFGVEGTYGGEPASVTWSVSNTVAGIAKPRIFYYSNGEVLVDINNMKTVTTEIGAMLVVLPPNGYTLTLGTYSGVTLLHAPTVVNEPAVFTITGDANIVVTYTKA